jgi:cell division protease FtsH
LVELDGFLKRDRVLLIGATNRPDVLDPALLRPGRFDRKVVVPFPDVRARLGILKVHAKGKPLAPDTDLESFASLTPGFSGSDLENLMNEAAIVAGKRDANDIELADLHLAFDTVVMGDRRQLQLSERDRKGTAYHEAGHAIVALKTRGTGDLHKVTIVPRGRALGVTWSIPEGDVVSKTRSELEKGIMVALGGREAEILIFKEPSTGAENDLQVATSTAKNMIRRWGMDPDIGPVSYAAEEGEVFVGRAMSASRNSTSEATEREIEEKVRDLLKQKSMDTRDILEKSRIQLQALAEALLKDETLSRAQIMALPEFAEFV